MIDAIGLFDEAFTPGYYEDTDLSFRARACDWDLSYCPLAYTHQGLGPERSTSHIKRDQLAERYGNFQKRNRNLFVTRWLAGSAPRLSEADIRLSLPSVYFPIRREVEC